MVSNFCQLLRLRKIPLIATYHGKLFFICKSVMKGLQLYVLLKSVANIMALLYSWLETHLELMIIDKNLILGDQRGLHIRWFLDDS